MQEDEEEALTLAETGDLANVVLRNGRAIGTLGHEEEMRKLRRQLIPKKVGVLWRFRTSFKEQRKGSGYDT
jgi:hypothetical protein